MKYPSKTPTNFHPHKPRYVHKISPQKTSPLFAAIHLFISSHDEIKDFCSMDKKTGRRYGQLLKFVLQFHSYGCVRFYLMRRDVTRRYKLRNHIQQ